VKFNYQARNKDGEIRIGKITVATKEEAVTFLQEQGLYIVSLIPEKKKAKLVFLKDIEFFSKVSNKDIVLFSQQLSIMFYSNVPLVDALKAYSTQTKNVVFKKQILKISQEIEAGSSFSTALSLYPKTFSSFYIAMIKAGEVSGNLSKTLNYLAEHLEREYDLAAKTKGALIYPALILLVMSVALTIMVVFILPQLSSTLAELGVPLPFITRVVLGMSDAIINWGFLIVIIIFLIAIILINFNKTKKGKFFFDHLWLRIPVAGRVLKMVYVTRFAENLSTLIAGGLPIVQAMKATEDILSNVAYKEVVFKVRSSIKKGKTISSVLFDYPDLFPSVFVQMVLVGEKTGSIDSVLMKIVSFYQKEIDRSIDAALSFLEPILMVFLGVVVGVIVVSVLLPLYQGMLAV